VETALGFAIIVDGEHFVPLIGDADTLARTEYLLVDVRAPLWAVSERVRMRDRASNQEAVQTTGFEWNSQTYERTVLAADASYEITGRVVSRRDLAQKEQDRMLHVALGFMAMLSHTKIAMKKIASSSDQGDHFCVELPRSYTVDQIVDDINHRRTSANIYYGTVRCHLETDFRDALSRTPRRSMNRPETG